MNNNYDIDDDIITLTTDNGEEIDYVQIAGVVYNGNYYVILRPVDGTDDDARVFKMTRDAHGEHFEIELDEETIAMVFEKYNNLMI